MRILTELFDNNRRWAEACVARQPDFFSRLTGQQSPQYLWIGCADSRVPANEIVGLRPGELFVHRNVANVVVHTDLNCLSVLQYAVDVLRVRHVIVCGHYGCGGVRAAFDDARIGLIQNWLRHVQDVHGKHFDEIERMTDPDAKVDRLCELNVVEQAAHVCKTTVVQDAWARGQPLAVHAWIYALDDGLLRDFGFTVESADDTQSALDAAVRARPLSAPVRRR